MKMPVRMGHAVKSAMCSNMVLCFVNGLGSAVCYRPMFMGLRLLTWFSMMRVTGGTSSVMRCHSW